MPCKVESGPALIQGMRGPIALLIHSLVLATAGLLAGCESNLPTPVPPEPPVGQSPIAVEAPPDATPRVVRRLVAEARQQMEKDRQMVAELRDPRGRARAQDEADALDRELAVLAQRVDDPDSDNLDDVMSRLQLLDTRIDIFHDKLRAATERSTAVLKD